MDLSALTVGQPEKLVASLAPRLRDCQSVEAACNVLCQELYTRCLAEGEVERSLVMSRLFLSLPFTALDPETARVARKGKGSPTPEDFCLTLMGSHGIEPEWCDRRLSAHQRVVWLSRHGQPRDPLIRRAVEQIGFDLARLGQEQEGIWAPRGIFLVEDAAEGEALSELRDAVKGHAVRSAVGCGSAFPDGAISFWFGLSRHPIREPGALPLMSLLPTFWYQIRALHRSRKLFS